MIAERGTAQANDMPPAARFDPAHFAMMTADDVELQREIVQIFTAQSELWFRLLIPDAPTPIWRDAAHTVKGAARGLGLFALAAICSEAEMLGKAGAIDGPLVTATLKRARDALTEALAALAEAVA